MHITKFCTLSDLPADTKVVIYGVAYTYYSIFAFILSCGFRVAYFVDKDSEYYESGISIVGEKIPIEVSDFERLKSDINNGSKIAVIMSFEDNSVEEQLKKIGLVLGESIFYANYLQYRQPVRFIDFTDKLSYRDKLGNKADIEGGFAKSRIIFVSGDGSVTIAPAKIVADNIVWGMNNSVNSIIPEYIKKTERL